MMQIISDRVERLPLFGDDGFQRESLHFRVLPLIKRAVFVIWALGQLLFIFLYIAK
jgi:hypothetical protein